MPRSLVSFCLLAGCAAAPVPVAAPPTPPGSPPAPHRAVAPPAYVLLEPAPDLPRAGQLAVFRPLPADHAQRAAIEAVLARPFLRWVLAVGEEAKRRARGRCGADVACARKLDHPAYFVIAPGGNRPHHGLAIASEGKTVELADAWYVEIDPAHASILIPHEYGHVLMAESLPDDLPQLPQTLPHTTGAITNHVVAFSEGWGIHFETLAGDRRQEVETYASWHRDAFAVAGPLAEGDSFVPVTDLFNYAQTYRRYGCIKDNCFAYLPRPLESYIHDRTPNAEDVLARWTDTTFDPALVRSLDQMVASEGVIAALFYRLATAPEPAGPPGAVGDPPLPDPKRYAAFFDAFAHITEHRASATPAVLVFLEALIREAAPEERSRIARIAMEVFHHTLVVRDAPRLYAELHAAGHRVDKPSFKQRLASATPELEAAVQRLAEHPESLAEVVGPALWIENEALRIDLPVLGLRQRPLVLDLNAAPIELLMTIPGVTYREASALDAARRSRSFRSLDDLAIQGVRRATLDKVRAMRAGFEQSHRAPP
ncbi:MAG: hypothetical protein H6Q90_1164 [Deltaproteobacteria bacterium]|nr:hypothetical protein [Deltaproteobacteria bacterium]